mmetsp:Transcript_73900/g.203441  ORF Transcript_73900/g.203441 Transcript_73900/m.203441 type:complete len:226 (+) Transcript_73900:485-1162(+)
MQPALVRLPRHAGAAAGSGRVSEGQPLSTHSRHHAQGPDGAHAQCHAADARRARVRLHPDDVCASGGYRTAHQPNAKGTVVVLLDRQADRVVARARHPHRAAAAPAAAGRCGRLALHLQPAARRRLQIRPAHLRGHHFLRAIARVHFRRGPRALLDRKVLVLLRRPQPAQYVHAPHQLFDQQALVAVRRQLGRQRRRSRQQVVALRSAALPRARRHRRRRPLRPD